MNETRTNGGSKAEIEQAILDISATLKQSGIPNVERLMLNEDRKDLRAELAALEAASNAPTHSNPLAPLIAQI